MWKFYTGLAAFSAVMTGIGVAAESVPGLALVGVLGVLGWAFAAMSDRDTEREHQARMADIRRTVPQSPLSEFCSNSKRIADAFAEPTAPVDKAHVSFEEAVETAEWRESQPDEPTDIPPEHQPAR